MSAGLCYFLYHRDIYHKKQSVKQLIKVWIHAKVTADLDGQVHQYGRSVEKRAISHCGEQWKHLSAALPSNARGRTPCQAPAVILEPTLLLGMWLLQEHTVLSPL